MMKKILVFTFALFLVLGLTIDTNAESYDQLPVMTAKAYSMGGAFTGVADDVGAVLFNPAGLTQSGIVGFQANAGVSDINTGELGEVVDFANEVSGELSFEDVTSLEESFPANTSLNAQAFAGANLKSVALSGNIRSSYDIYDDSGDKVLENNNDISAIISYGAKLASPPVEVASLAYGFNIKMTQHNYNEYRLNGDKLTQTEAKGNSIDLDFGVLAKVTDIFKVGAQIENIYSSGYDLEGEEILSSYDPGAGEWNEEESNDYSDTGKEVKRNLRVGASVEVPIIGTTVAADLENITALSQTEGVIYHLGLQQNLFFNLISVRAGTYGPEINGEDSTYTAGIGLNLTKLHLDAAVGSDKSGDNMSGMISGRFKF
ncbi:MAG: hypothetical protein ACQEQD_07590 [Bacillota bacterium]